MTPEPGASALAESSGKCGVSGLDHSLALPNADLYTSAYLSGLGPCSEILQQWRGSAPHPVPLLLQTALEQVTVSSSLNHKDDYLKDDLLSLSHGQHSPGWPLIILQKQKGP